MYDMDTAGKPPDKEIASAWGLADARSVREVRESAEYKTLLAELQSRAISHMGEKVLDIQNTAIDSLSEIVPLLSRAVVRMLSVPEGTVHPEQWRPAYRDLTAANNAVSTIVRIANFAAITEGEVDAATQGTRTQSLPTTVMAESDTSIITEKYSLVVERLRRGKVDEPPIDAHYEILQDSEAEE